MENGSKTHTFLIKVELGLCDFDSQLLTTQINVNKEHLETSVTDVQPDINCKLKINNCQGLNMLTINKAICDNIIKLKSYIKLTHRNIKLTLSLFSNTNEIDINV